MPVSAADAADSLYALPPGEFRAARDALVARAREAGQRDAAAAIGKLGRPTVSAWLVNQLVRAAPGLVDRLLELGVSLRAAQRVLAAEQLQDLSRERRQLMAELLLEVGRLAAAAGQPAGAQVMREVQTTLEAALADEQAAAAVRVGRLTRPLSYVGIGEVDLAGALIASSARSARGAPDGAAAGSSAAARQAGARDAAARALREAEDRLAAAVTALDEAERRASGLAEQRLFLRRRIDQLRQQLDESVAEDAQLGRDARQAQQAKDAAGRRLAAAQRRLDALRS